MTPDQKTALQLLERLRADAIRKTKATQIRSIIPIENWVENKYYVGESGLKLYPFWKEQLCEIFSSKRSSKYNEIILEAALGVGKTTVANFMMVRKLYELSCYSNVQAMYNLMSSSTIYLMYFTLTLSSAKNTGFDQFRDTVDSIPYFQKEFPRNDKNNTVLEYPGNIKVTYGSNIGHQIGTNLIMGMLDEANFHEGAENSAKLAQNMQSLSGVMELYNSIINRGGSRFMRDGKNDSMMILISSPRASSSITQTRIDQTGSSETTKIVHCRKWDVAPQNYGKTRFWVFLGNSRLDPFIVNTVEELDRIINSEGLPLRKTKTIEDTIASFDPQLRSLFDDVPIEFKKQYESSIINAIQDISGKTTSPTGRLFSSRKIFNDCVDEKLPNVFWRDSFTISTGDNSDSNSIEHYFKGPFLAPSAPRFLHVDQSCTTDCTGMACTYPGKPMMQDGVQVPTFVIEWALRIVPPTKPNKISISKVRSFIYYMKNVANLNIGKVTYDTYQCLSGNTVVETKNGFSTLERIVPGEFVLSYDGYRKVLNKFVYRDVPRVMIGFDDGTAIEGTPTHRIMTVSGLHLMYKTLSDIDKGDEVVSKNGTKTVSSKESTGTIDSVYDIEVTGDHCYYANGILSHNSAEALEDLQRNGIENSHLSMDRTDEQYITFIDLLQQNRLRFSPQVAALMATELFDLNHYREKGKVDHLPNKCLVGGTEILLGNGKKTRIDKLAGMSNIPVIGCAIDPKTKTLSIVPAVATRVWMTKMEKKLCRVHLSNGTTIECTRDHRIMLQGGYYRRAEKLKRGDLLTTCKYGAIKVLGENVFKLFTVTVNRVELYEEKEPVPVYDMEVPATHNFALGNDVIVHNSKDVMDAVVGSVWNALKSDKSNAIFGQDLYDVMTSSLDDSVSFSDLLANFGIKMTE